MKRTGIKVFGLLIAISILSMLFKSDVFATTNSNSYTYNTGEPNDYRSQAIRMELGREYIGELGSYAKYRLDGEDSDYYVVNFHRAVKYRIEVNDYMGEFANTSMRIEIFDPSNNIHYNYNDMYKFGINYFDFEALQTGLYYIKLSGYYDYLNNADHFYSLRVTAYESVIPERYDIGEPNNSRATATQISLGETCTGELGSYLKYSVDGPDTDWFVCNLNKGVKYRIRLYGYLSEFSNTTMLAWLLPPSTEGWHFNFDLEQYGVESLSFYAEETGKYYIKLYNYFDYRGGREHYYGLRITEVPVDNSIRIKSITLNQTKALMSLNDRIQLNISKITPVNATNTDLIWSSSNESVATVTANGLVTCVGPGNCKITATTTDGSKKKATCTITGPKQASSVKITGPKTIDYLGTAQLSAEVKPFNAVNKGVTWSIDKGMGTVDANGLVTCTGSGDIKVRATTSNGKKATYTLKGPKAASSVKITGPKTIDYHGTAQLTATVKPDNAVDKTVTWSIDKGNGQVDANGLVTCNGSGDIKVRATSSNGKKATYTLKGPKAASSVKITGPKTIDYQGTAQLAATVKPDNAIDKSVTWSIDKGNGEVDANGVVTCTGSGDIKVRATSANGKKATYTLKGPKAAASVKITGEKNISLNGTVQLTATVKPDNAIDKTVTWEVDKGNGVVDTNGVVTCTGAGDIKVRATTVTNKKGTFTIKGPKAASSVSVNKSSYKLAVGESVQPVATVKPANAIDLTVTWSSSDPAIATVAPDGVITAVAPGKTTILATAHNGKVGKCSVTVN